MRTYYTNENTLRGLTDQERQELDERIIDTVEMWKGEGLDIANHRYVDQVRYKGMTFFIEVFGEENFIFEEDDDESFMGFTDDAEIEVRRIG